MRVFEFRSLLLARHAQHVVLIHFPHRSRNEASGPRDRRIHLWSHYVQMLVETGAAGFLAALWFIVLLYRNTLQKTGDLEERDQREHCTRLPAGMHGHPGAQLCGLQICRCPRTPCGSMCWPCWRRHQKET
jgi:hypothetical protein